MQTLAALLSLLLLNVFAPCETGTRPSGPVAPSQQAASRQRQLAAVRGEIVRIKSRGSGLLAITVRPAKEFAEATVVARENDPVGAAVGRSGEADLIGLLTGDSQDAETITAAELSEGDVVSVIYDPQLQNQAVEIYLHP